MARSAPRSATYRRFLASDLETVDAMMKEAFQVDADTAMWDAQGRILEEAGAIVAGLCLEPIEQYFGGRAVPAVVLQWVIVHPGGRGRGSGRRIVLEALRESAEGGAAIMCGYPAITAFYRKLGFEISGLRCRFSCDMASVRAYRRPRPSTRIVMPRPPGPHADVERCYDSAACTAPGMIRRSPDWWTRRILRAPGSTHLRLATVDGDDCLGGYVIYHHEPAPGPLEPFVIDCHELVVRDPESWDALLSFLCDQGRLATQLRWIGPTDEARFPLELDQAEIRVDWCLHSLARLLNVAVALEARGYPSDASFAVDLLVTDKGLGAPDQPLHVEVSDGSACVRSQSATSGAQLDVATLASIYCGWLHPETAVALGRLNATAAEAARLAVMFAGRTPFTFETF